MTFLETFINFCMKILWYFIQILSKTLCSIFNIFHWRYRYFHLRFSFFCQQLIYIIIFLSTISETKISDIHFLKLLTLWLLARSHAEWIFFLSIKIFFSLEHGGRHDEPGDGAHPRHEEGGGSAWRGAPGGRISGICGNNKDDKIEVTIKTTKI